ncbi:MAG: DnaB-like helicase C-terminal domain-containing protein [Bacteroidales bacterium]|jgi:replicative DNA helicase
MSASFFDINSEYCLLGQTFDSVDTANQVITNLTTEDFHLKEHKLLFLKIKELYEKDLPITFQNIVAICKDDEFTYDFLFNVSRSNTSFVDSELIEILRKKRHAREILDYSVKLANDLKVEFNLDQLIKHHLNESNKVFTDQDKKEFAVFGDFLESKTVYNQALKNKENLEKGIDVQSGLKTNFSDLDKKICGLNKGHLIVIGARPGMGKTSLMLNMISKMKEKKAGIFSLEMTADELMTKYLLINSKVNYSLFREGKLDQKDLQTIYQATEVLKQRVLIIDDTPGIKPNQVYGRALRMKKAYGVEVIYIDYLQLMKGDDYNYESNQVKIASISHELKGISKKLDMPVVALAQLNRQVEQRESMKPRMSDLRESGAIEADADLILLLNKKMIDERATYSDLEIFIEKNRFGETGQVSLYWDLTIGNMENKQYETEQSPFEGNNDWTNKY